MDQVTMIRGGSELIARCPICGDSKKDSKKRRFHLNFEKFAEASVHCFNCDWSGSIVGLIMAVQKCDINEAKQIAGYRSWGNVKQSWRRIADPIEDQEKIKDAPTIYNMIIKSNCFEVTEQFQLVSGIRKSILNEKCVGFLQSRGLNPQEYTYYACYSGKYINRLILPILDEESIIYFQARSLSKNQMPKYLNPASPKEIIVFNKNNFDSSKPVIILEGLIDCLSLMVEGNFNVSCCMGKVPTIELVESILNEIDREVIICMDNDTPGLIGTHKAWKEFRGNNRVRYYLLSEMNKNNKYNDINEMVVQGEMSPLHIVSDIEERSISSQMLPLVMKAATLKPGGSKK